MSAGRYRSLAAAILALALVSVVSAPPTHAAGMSASWSGRVFQPDRTQPRAGVVVSLVDAGADRSVRSQPTRADGAFALADVPAGRYDLRVEAPEGVFVAGNVVTLEPGANTPMALTLNPATLNAARDQGLGGEASRTTEFIIAGGVGLAALAVWFLVTEDDSETNASVE